MHPGFGRLAYDRPGELSDEHGRGERQQRGQQRPEDDDQQDQDEHDGQVLAEVARSRGTLAGVDLRGHLTGQVRVQITWQGAGLDGVAQAVSELLSGAVGADVHAGQDLKLHGLTVAADAEVLDPLHAGHPG